jgi:hypothetical protein
MTSGIRSVSSPCLILPAGLQKLQSEGDLILTLAGQVIQIPLDKKTGSAKESQKRRPMARTSARFRERRAEQVKEANALKEKYQDAQQEMEGSGWGNPPADATTERKEIISTQSVAKPGSIAWMLNP